MSEPVQSGPQLMCPEVVAAAAAAPHVVTWEFVIN